MLSAWEVKGGKGKTAFKEPSELEVLLRSIAREGKGSWHYQNVENVAEKHKSIIYINTQGRKNFLTIEKDNSTRHWTAITRLGAFVLKKNNHLRKMFLIALFC